MAGPEQTGAPTVTLAPVEGTSGAYLLMLNAPTPLPIPLPSDGQVTIGRSAQAAVRILHEAVSRQHARLALSGGAARLSDLDSHNGTRINGVLLDGERGLVDGDVIGLGPVMLAFHAGAATGDAAVAGEAAPATLQIGVHEVIVAEPLMTHTFELIRRLAVSDLPVLLTGETGVGKELAAAAVHAWSQRRGKPFVAVNCAAIQDTLIESELFGFERGAFSGAVAAKAGLLESAAGGTVFLDEVGELSASAQAKLLRVLETRRLTRVGATQSREVDLRLVAATNRALLDEVKAQRFRQDLYYRLSAAVVTVPPLRERRRELPLLARRFLDLARARLGYEPLLIADDALEALSAHGWPGNIRELKNTMEYLAAVVHDGTLTRAQVLTRLGAAPEPPAAASTGPRGKVADELRTLERQRMVDALEQAGGNKTRAAELIGMPIRTFTHKLKQYGLTTPKSGG